MLYVGFRVILHAEAPALMKPSKFAKAIFPVLS